MPDLSQEFVARICAVSEVPEEQARASLEPVLGDLEPLPGRSWRNFRIPSVQGALLLVVGKPAEAAEMAFRGLALDPQDELAHRILSDVRKAVYVEAIKALHQKRPDRARGLLDKGIELFRKVMDVSAERSAAALMEFVEAAGGPEAPPVPPRGRPTVVSLGTWGERYIAAAERAYLPCCLAPGNFPELKKHGTVYLRIHTAEKDVARIHDLPVVRELSNHACIDVKVLPDRILNGTALAGRNAWNRMLFAAYSYADVMFARSIGADIMMGGGDWLVANKCLSTAKKLLVDGYVAVVVQPIRAVADKVQSIIEAEGCRSGNCLDIPSDMLYRASLEAIHPVITDSFMRQSPTKLPIDPIQFCFPAPDGFSLRSLQMSILAASTRTIPADLGCDFHTYDARLLSDLLVGLDRTKACYVHHQMPGELNYAALDEADGVASFGDFELSPKGAVESIYKWMGRYEDLDHFAWAVQQRFEYPIPEGINFTPPPACREEDQAVAEIVSLLKERRMAFFEKVRQYRD